MDANKKVSRAVTKLCNSKPFWGSLMLTIGHVESKVIPTAATNGKRIMWNRDFIDKITEAQARGLMCHELMHIILFHCEKHGLPYDDNREMCNIAMDIVINQTLLDDGMELPDGGIVPEERFRGMTWKEVYKIIAKEEKYQKMAEKPDLMDVLEADESLTPEEKLKIKQKIIQAAEAAKASGIGSLPGGIEQIIEEIRTPQVDWREYIQEVFQSRYPEDFTFTRPNRKFLETYGIYMPTMHGTKAGTIVVHMDTSGSVDMDERIEYLAEVNEISVKYRPEKVIILYTDAEVSHVQTFEEDEEITHLEMSGWGGTDFNPSFKWLEENEIVPDQMLIFSDMEVDSSCFPDEAPDYPVLFLSTRRYYNVPFGECITTGD